MKMFYLLLLLPFYSYSQNEIRVFIDSVEITKAKDCPFYAEFGNSRRNLLDSNLYSILLEQDSFFITGNIFQKDYKSESLKLIRFIQDAIEIKFDSIVLLEKIKPTKHSSEPIFAYRKFEINTIQYKYIQFESGNFKTNTFTLKPAFYLKEEPIYFEKLKTNPSLLKKYFRRLRKLKKSSKS